MILLEKDDRILKLTDSRWSFSDGEKSEFFIPASEYFAAASAVDGRMPVNWRYGKITGIELVNGGVILSGSIETDHGVINCRDCCEIKSGLLHIRRRWSYSGGTEENVMLSYRFRLEQMADVLLPGVLYFGNPSGRNTPGVPFLDVRPGEMAFFEEHRMPMPFISAEKDSAAGAIHFVPSTVTQSYRPDSWWSCGVRYGENFTELAGLSGFVSCNGHHGWRTHRGRCIA